MTPLDVIEGRARWCVLHADNREVLPMLGDKSVTHVITDPPYSERMHSKRANLLSGTNGVGGLDGGRRATDLGFAHIEQSDRLRFSAECARLATRWSLRFCDCEAGGDWRVADAEAGLDYVRWGTWVRLGAMPQFSGDRPAHGTETIIISHAKGRKRWNGGGKHAVWTYPIVGGDERTEHTTQKPLPLMLELVELFTDPDDIILDPFCGSGTTGVACLRLGRRFIGIEKDAKYAAVATERLQAESQGLTLRDARAGQLSLLGGA